MNANIIAGKETGSLKNGLEIALIVLVVILIIVALIVGFTRLKKSDEEEGEQTYY
jgi:flagellar basal body-associated protein FliL